MCLRVFGCKILYMVTTRLKRKCSVDTSYSLTLYRQFNDSIATAIEIFEGKNGEYSNFCAGIEDSEPIPPFTSCTGQDSWCDEYGTGEDIIENSVWFYFVPKVSGTYKLSSEGMDNQIAVYQAANPDDLFSGNYTLVGANDDITATDYNPVIEKLILMEDSIYWIQVDGSAGGAEGKFFLYMEFLRFLSTGESISGGEMRVFPQPAGDQVTVEWEIPAYRSKMNVQIFDSTGRIIYNNIYDSEQGKFEVNTRDWSRGLYYIMLDNGNFIKSIKMIK